jgi:hypothetical protein
MSLKRNTVFLLLVIVQAFHSVEEYIGVLWDVFPPATFLCSLFSDDLEKGFLIVNIGFFVLGIMVWYFLVGKGHFLAKFFIWFWVIIELINGIGHTAWAITYTSYKPGLITAPILFAIAMYLGFLFLKPTDDGKARSVGS